MSTDDKRAPLSAAELDATRAVERVSHETRVLQAQLREEILRHADLERRARELCESLGPGANEYADALAELLGKEATE